MLIFRVHPKYILPRQVLRQAGFASSRYRRDAPHPPREQSPPSKKPKDGLPKPSLQESSPTTGAISHALQEINAADNTLLAPVHIPEDQNAILKENHPATQILANSAIVVQRQLELMNVLLGFEQANKYVILDPQGNHLGFIAEQDLGVGKTMARQIFSTHRSFTAHVFDKNEKEVLRVRIPKGTLSMGMLKAI